MVINIHTHTKYFLTIFSVLCLVILTACSAQKKASTPAPLPPTPIPTDTQAPPSATPTPRPFPDLNEWDLLVISSSYNWGVGAHYANLIEKDMNVKVNLHDCWVANLEIASALKTLQNGGYLYPFFPDQSCSRPWSELINEAEVMILFGGAQESGPPDGAWDIPEVFTSCYLGGYEGMNLQPGFETYKKKLLKSCAPETFVTYRAHLGAFLDEIEKIRDGRPLILRMTDMFIATHSNWVKNDVNDVCTKCVGYISEVIRQVAAEHGVPVASTMLGFNGEIYQMDSPAEYFRSDFHLSDAGAQFVANLLQQTGYAYAGK